MRHTWYRIKTYEYEPRKPLIVQDFQSEKNARSFYFSTDITSLYPSIRRIEFVEVQGEAENKCFFKPLGEAEETILEERINPQFDSNWDRNLNEWYAIQRARRAEKPPQLSVTQKGAKVTCT